MLSISNPEKGSGARLMLVTVVPASIGSPVYVEHPHLHLLGLSLPSFPRSQSTRHRGAYAVPYIVSGASSASEGLSFGHPPSHIQAHFLYSPVLGWSFYPS